MLPAFLPAEAPPALAPQERLFDNGRSFTSLRQRLPIRCYDAPGLLGLPVSEQAAALDRAAAAGFNSVSFEAPLFGPNSLAPKLGAVDDAKRQALGRLLEACALRQLYALPVLYPISAVEALGGTDTAHVTFFAGRNALGWQGWALRELAKLQVKGQPLAACPTVAGWVLYRGPWPDGSPLPNRPAPLTPSAEARLSGWAAWQVKLARKLGFKQELGLGLWAKQDLGATLQANAPAYEAQEGGPAPVAAMSTMSFDPAALNQQTASLDGLPPVPGAEAEKVDDSASVPAAPASPWDLEGLDWERVDALFQGLPTTTQLDFVELTLDTEDWYRVGDRLAEAAAKAEVPVLWRQDWRNASRYERNKRLAPPAPLAGLLGPWPDEDWPASGESLWAGHDAPSAENAPFYVRAWSWDKGEDGPVLVVQLSRPAELSLKWGKRPPLDQTLTGPQGAKGPKAEHRFTLKGLKGGDWFLMRLDAESPKFGSALVRSRWMQVPR